MLVSLREYQRAAVDAVHAAAARALRRVLVVMATGLGKSLCAGYVIKERPGRAVMLAHRDELLRGLGRAVLMANPNARIGYVKAEEDDVSADVVIASLQTLARPARLQRLLDSQRGDLYHGPRPFVTVIQDEGHHIVGGDDENTFGAVLRGLGAFDPDGPLVVGWTATPERGDGKALGTTWQEIPYQMGILDGIRGGYLCELRAKQVRLSCDFNRLHISHGDFKDNESEAMLLEANAPRHAAEAYLRHAAGRRALAFVPTVATAQAFAEAFRAAGVPAEAVHGDMPIEEQRAVKARVERGETLVSPNAQLWTEGFDLPAIECVIMARPTRSRPFAIQMIGRATRIHPGKRDALILDLVGSTARLDLVTVASLFDVSPEAAERGVLQATTEKSRAEQQELHEGTLVSKDVDLFPRSSFSWVPANDAFVLGLGKIRDEPQYRRFVVIEADGPDAWKVVGVRQEKRKVGRFERWTDVVRKTLHAGLSMEYAMGAAEDLARRLGAGALTDKNAAWRDRPPNEGMRAAMERLGKWHPQMSAGEASDILSAREALRVARG